MTRTKPLTTLLAVLALVGCAHSPARSSQVAVSWTAPVNDNAGACLGPRLLVPATDSVWVVFHIPGVLRDSVRAARGQSGKRGWTIPPGTYTLRVWAAHNGVAGCDTSRVVQSFAGPDTPTLSGP